MASAFSVRNAYVTQSKFFGKVLQIDSVQLAVNHRYAHSHSISLGLMMTKTRSQGQTILKLHLFYLREFIKLKLKLLSHLQTPFSQLACFFTKISHETLLIPNSPSLSCLAPSPSLTASFAPSTSLKLL